jgi:hypothetical protein
MFHTIAGGKLPQGQMLGMAPLNDMSPYYAS